MTHAAGRAFAETLFAKTAAPRYLRELRRGAVSAADRLRMGGGSLSNLRRSLQAPTTDLNPQQLARHRRLQGMLAEATAKVTPGSRRNLVGAGPATLFGQIHMSPQTGTMLRYVAEGSPAQRRLAMGALASGQDLPTSALRRLARPEDGGVYRALFNHERAERAMFSGAGPRGYEPNYFSSHLGPAAVLAERQGVRDPRVHAVLDKLRTTMGEDDPRAFKLFRQAGVVAGNAPPLGGRAHRSLERLIARMPTALSEGGAKRGLVGTGAAGPWPDRVEALARRVDPYVPASARKPFDAVRRAVAGLREETRAPVVPFQRWTQADVANHVANFAVPR